MIHVFVGTKAQFIKMAPIMQELERRRIPYNFIDSGQHAGLSGELIDQFELRAPDVRLRSEQTNIATVWDAARFTMASLGSLLFRADHIRKLVFRGEGGLCLIHGDTLTTLLSLLYARRCGLAVAHVEAGLRSYRLFDPFPEELIRLIAMRFSHYLFAPSDWAFENLQKMGYQEKAVNVGGNTVVDAVAFARERYNAQVQRPSDPYVVVTTHRVETIYSRTRLSMIVTLLERIAMERKVLFVLHEPTAKQLARFNLLERLEDNRSIEMRPLQPYLLFLDLLSGAEFIITDGGSIQEESYVLNVPCLVMRNQTERTEGLGENVFLAGFNQARIEEFFSILPTLHRNGANAASSPSQLIVNQLERFC